jgi:hypothetical protein
MLFKSDLAIVRIEEHGHHIGWIKVGDLVVLLEL